MKRQLLSGPYLIWMGLFTVIPLAIVLYYAFTDSLTGSFTVKNIASLGTYLPIFLNGRVYFSKSRNAVYFDLKGGYALADAKGGFLEPSLGLSCALGGGAAINMALTFEWLRVEYSDNSSSWGTFYEKDHINTSSIGFTVGLEF